MRMRSAAPGNIMQLVAGVCACAALAPALAQSPPVSSIRVTGDAKVTARPDRVQIDIGVTTHAVTSQEAAMQNARAVDTVLSSVRKATGPAAVLKTISYSLNPNYQYPSKAKEPPITGSRAVNAVEGALDHLR